jgi:prolyl 4-hydroxylase
MDPLTYDAGKDAPDAPRLARIGRQVRERLARNPAVYHVDTGGRAEIYAVGDFFSADECARMMAMIDAVAKPSKAFDVAYETGYRTSYSGDMDPNDHFVRQMQRKLDDFMGMEPDNSETIQGQRYLPGQQFKPHTDWFPPGTPYWDVEKDRGGQRCYTAMAYLNAVEEGGSTDFPHLGISIEPRPGTLLLWNNATPEGIVNPWTIHAGMPVVTGVKYVITKWYRARGWI